jgi:hypothetical protein
MAQGISPGVPVGNAHAAMTNTQAYYDEILGTVFGFLPLTTEKVKKGAHVAFKVAKDGEVKDVQLSESSDSFEDNFNALVALRDIYRVSAPPQDFQGNTVDFSFINSNAVLASPDEREALRQANSEARKKFLKMHPNLMRKVVLYNFMPLTILDKYPGVFSIEEMCLPSKLRAISKKQFADNGQMPDPKKILKNETLMAIHDSWRQFFQSHDIATKQELLAQCEFIDRRYRSFFIAQ